MLRFLLGNKLQTHKVIIVSSMAIGADALGNHISKVMQLNGIGDNAFVFVVG